VTPLPNSVAGRRALVGQWLVNLNPDRRQRHPSCSWRFAAGTFSTAIPNSSSPTVTWDDRRVRPSINFRNAGARFAVVAGASWTFPPQNSGWRAFIAAPAVFFSFPDAR